MPTDDRQIIVAGQASAPAQWVISGSGQIRPKAVFAHFDGTGAAGPFLPALKVISDGGKTVGIYPTTVQVAAGGTADVSWFRGLGGTGVTSGSGIPPFPALDDYVFKHANTAVTGVGFSDQTALIIQGNPVALDGATRVKVEFFAPLVELSNSFAVAHQAIGFSLWDGATNKGVICYVEAGNYTKNNGAVTSEFGGPVYGAVILTPSAGTHTYAIYAFINQAAGAGVYTVYANTFVDGTGNLSPCWYRVTTT